MGHFTIYISRLADTPAFLGRMTVSYGLDHAMDATPRRPGDDHYRQVRRAHRHGGEQRVDRGLYPVEFPNGYNGVLDTEEPDLELICVANVYAEEPNGNISSVCGERR